MARTQRRTPPSQKAGYHHGDLRRALLDAALALVGEGSVGNVSLREVARRAGVTYAAPYHHFKDKSALLAAVACQGFEMLIAEFERVAARHLPFPSEFLAMAEAYVTFALTHPSHYRVMFLPEVKESPEAEEFHAAGERAYNVLLRQIARARPGESEREHHVLATTIWAALHGISMLGIDGILQNTLPKSQLRKACQTILGMALAAS